MSEINQNNTYVRFFSQLSRFCTLNTSMLLMGADYLSNWGGTSSRHGSRNPVRSSYVVKL